MDPETFAWFQEKLALCEGQATPSWLFAFVWQQLASLHQGPADKRICEVSSVMATVSRGRIILDVAARTAGGESMETTLLYTPRLS